MKLIVAGCALAAVLFAQQFKFNLDHLAKKSSDTVDLSLDANLIQLGAAFLNTKDPDQAKAKKLVAGLQGLYIKSFEFKRDGEYSPADLDQIRAQLKAPEWARMVNVSNSEDRESVEVWVRTENGKMSGVAILAAEPRNLTVVNLVGSIELSSLSDLGGNFGIPKIPKKK